MRVGLVVPGLPGVGHCACSTRITTRRCSPAMKTNEQSKHEEQLPRSNNPGRKKPYEAPKITLLKLDREKAELVARAMAGDRDAEDLLEAADR